MLLRSRNERAVLSVHACVPLLLVWTWLPLLAPPIAAVQEHKISPLNDVGHLQLRRCSHITSSEDMPAIQECVGGLGSSAGSYKLHTNDPSATTAHKLPPRKLNLRGGGQSSGNSREFSDFKYFIYGKERDVPSPPASDAVSKSSNKHQLSCLICPKTQSCYLIGANLFGSILSTKKHICSNKDAWRVPAPNCMSATLASNANT
jgi:hypothetical protein